MMKIRRFFGSMVAISTLAVAVPAENQALAAPSTEHADARAEPLSTLAADVTQLTVYGPTARGLRVDVAFKGTLHGRINGIMEGIDYSTIRADGTTEINVHAKITTQDQALISVEIQGVLVNGQVSDTSVRFLTAAPQYAYLQDKIVIGKGIATTEKLAIKYFLVQ